MLTAFIAVLLFKLDTSLSRVFRGKFIGLLAAQRTAGHWPTVAAAGDWQHLKTMLHAHDWVVYAKQPLGGPEQVLAYLGRYTHRVAISNERIVGINADGVRFRVRADALTGAKQTVLLSGTEFIGRFLLHVLPTGFKRIRHYGLLAPAHKTRRLAMARAALGAPPPDPAVVESMAAFMQRVAQHDWLACVRCGGGRLVVTGALPAVRRASASSRGPPVQ